MLSPKFAQCAAFVTGLVFMSSNPTQAHYDTLDPKIKAQHEAFLATMMGQCCYGYEVVYNVRQMPNAKGGYTIVVPKGWYPGQTEEKIIIFSDKMVKTREQLEQDCLLNYAENEEMKKTCTPIPMEMNIAFINPKTFSPLCVLPRFDLG